MIKFGKKSESLLSHKRSFFDNNDLILEESLDQGRLYAAQPERLRCKNCNLKRTTLDTKFRKQNIPYWFCKNCEHLNGFYEDTEDFCIHVYTGEGGKNYAKNYRTLNKEEYKRRLADIYMPKARFLINSLKNEKVNVKSLSLVDLGAGSGYFVNALYSLGGGRPIGYEVSQDQVDFGNSMIGIPLLKHISLKQLETVALTSKCTVISMIGVLEHLRNPYKILLNISRNEFIKYLFISVPLFSPTVFFEMVFPQIMQRHLSGGHTHLYTDNSLNWLCEKFNYKRISEWWFGTDMVDLFRSIHVSLEKQSQDPAFVEKWSAMFLPMIDKMQLVFDKGRLSSEVHLLIKKQ